MINLEDLRKHLQFDITACVDSFTEFTGDFITESEDMKSMLCQIVLDRTFYAQRDSQNEVAEYINECLESRRQLLCERPEDEKDPEELQLCDRAIATVKFLPPLARGKYNV